MARTSNNGGGENKAAKPPVESKAAKTPARRRSDKTRPVPTAAANDTAATRNPGGISLNAIHGGPNLAEVQRRAYELYVKRGGIDGHDKDDWFEAERQLRQQH